MKTTNKKKVTLMLDAAVYAGLQELVGARGVGEYLSRIAKPYVVTDDIKAGYQALANDKSVVRERKEWLSGTEEIIDAENVWEF